MPQRFDANPGYYNKEITTEDIIPGTHKSGATGTDNKLTIGQLGCIAIASCTTPAGTANKTASILNASLFNSNFSIQHSFERNEQTLTEYLIGLPVKVQFTYGNTADAPTLKIGNTDALPITVNGIRMGANALGAGNYTFRLVPYGSSYAWECEDNGGVVSRSTDTVTYSDGSTSYNKNGVDGALARYERIVYLDEDYASYTNDEWVLHLTAAYNVKNGSSVIFIFNSAYLKRVRIVDFLGGNVPYDFICGKCILTRFGSGQISIIYDINTYYLNATERYYENILSEFSITASGQGKWNYYVKDTDLNNALTKYVNVNLRFSGIVNANETKTIPMEISPNVVKIGLARMSNNLFVEYISDKSWFGGIKILSGTAISGVTVTMTDNTIVIANTTSNTLRFYCELY